LVSALVLLWLGWFIAVPSNFALKRKQCSGVFGGAVRATSPRDWLRKRTLGHHRNKMTVKSQYAKELRYSNTTYTNKPMDTRLPSLCDPLFLCTTVILHSKPRMSRNYNNFMFA
jgi:hypothetical protein